MNDPREMAAEELSRVMTGGAPRNYVGRYSGSGGQGSMVEPDRAPGSIGSGFAQMSILIDGIAGLLTTLESRLDAVLLPNAPTMAGEKYPSTAPPPRSTVGSRSHELNDQLSVCLARLQSIIARVDL